MSPDLAAPCSSGANLDVHDQAPIERHDEPGAGAVALEASDDGRRAALEDADDASFGAAVGDALDPRHDAVAVHRLVQVAAGDVDVALDVFGGALGDDEAEAARVGGDPPDDEVHPVGQAVAVAPRLDQRAVGGQRPSGGA